MTHQSSTLASAGALTLLVALAAAPVAHAAALSFVSMKGVNTGDCSNPAAPCRTFAYAIVQTSAGGEIRALDAGNFGLVGINKSITISGPPGAGVMRNTAGNAININAINGVVTLDGLTLNGVNRIATVGVNVLRASSVIIRNCTIKHFLNFGVQVRPSSSTTQYQIENTLLINNGDSGVNIASGNATGFANGELNRATVFGSGFGLALDARSTARLADTMIAQNSSTGITLGASTSALRLTRSVVTQHGLGISISPGSLVETGNDNFIFGNTVDANGALTNVGLN